MLRSKLELRSTRNLFLLFLIAVFAPAPYLQARPGDLAVAWQPPSLVDGSVLGFELRAPAGTRRVSGTWLGRQVRLFETVPNQPALEPAAPLSKPSLAESSWYGLAGIPLETSPGTYELKVTAVLGNGESREVIERLRIGRAVFPKITVKVAQQYTQPSAEQVRQINADKEVKQQIFAKETPERQWNGRFM